MVREFQYGLILLLGEVGSHNSKSKHFLAYAFELSDETVSVLDKTHCTHVARERERAVHKHRLAHFCMYIHGAVARFVRFRFRSKL